MIDYLYYIQNNQKIPKNLIKNKHIDYSKNKLKIDIIMLIYFYEKKGQRYYFQSFIFDYYIKLKNIFSNYIDFSFTIVGSEKNLSKNITTSYFKESDYYEFYQNPKLSTIKMLSKKINYAFRKSYNKNTDLLLWFGSNDYVCAHYFTNILEKYNNGFQQYGMSNYFNGNNFCLYIELEDLIFNVDDMYIHDGVHNYSKRQNYKYIGGSHGYSRKLLDKFPEILDKINCDEGANEYLVTKLNEKHPKLNINSMKTDNCFFFNIKFGNEEINSFNLLKHFNKKNIVDINNHKLKHYNNFKLIIYNLKYIQNYNENFIEKYIPKIPQKENIIINKNISIIETFTNNFDLLQNIKRYDELQDKMDPLINIYLNKNEKVNIKNIKDYIDLKNNFNILLQKYNNLIENLKTMYKKKQTHIKVYKGSSHLREIKDYIDYFNIEDIVHDTNTWTNKKNKILKLIESKI